MPRTVRLNPQASSSSIGDLLKDPTPQSAGQSLATPTGGRSRPSSAASHMQTPGGSVANVLQGESERSNGNSMRRMHGCDVHSDEGRGKFTSRKNYTSAPHTELQHLKGRATVCPGKNHNNTHTVLDPSSAPDLKNPKKHMERRMNDHHGDIIQNPPAVEICKKVRNGDAGAEHKSNMHHGDIITGRDQNLSLNTGKNRSALGVSKASQGTYGLLHWPASDTPTRASTSRGGGRANESGGKNRSALMQDAMSGTARRPKAEPPQGMSSIDRLAMGIAFAVVAPRSNEKGVGIADLKH
eukprot:CAMPEP_0181309332 /NCGR_PEP_ID=MMETSP1101-20121128/11956_1 /TAXON_ID=46948 /ORGANISM="Rhodomonas abbreviata, Strain Caron Lab Isolate" /LENGTH=296 /DNA_ID=CAMNT_0023415807 /DNA_START=127 /DNA_END=1017 /DNA_ORIENTATION=-